MELILKIGDVAGDAAYKDGDVVQAISMDDIKRCHAELKCHINNFPLDPYTGLRSSRPLLIKYLESIHLYKYERLNSNEIMRTNLETSETTLLSSVPNEDGEYIHAYSFISKRIKSPRHKIFGKIGNEFWYAKSRSFDSDSIWNDIETHTDFRKEDHMFWPLSDAEKRAYLAVNCRGFRNSVFNELSGDTVCDRMCSVDRVVNEGTEGEYNELIAKRRWRVPYWDLSSDLSISIDDARDSSKMLDARTDINERHKVDDISVDKVQEGIVVEQ